MNYESNFLSQYFYLRDRLSIAMFFEAIGKTKLDQDSALRECCRFVSAEFDILNPSKAFDTFDLQL